MVKKTTEKALSRKEREFEARRKEILSAALRVFSQKGYHQTSMNEIAKEAEFSIGSLYNFFKDKEDLFLTLFKEQLNEITQKVNEIVEHTVGAREKLEALINTLFSYFETNWEAIRIISLSHQDFESSLKNDIGNVIREGHLRFIQLVARILQQGIEQGAIKSFKPEEMALGLIGLINGSIYLWLESNRAYSLKDRAQGLMDIFYNGVAKK